MAFLPTLKALKKAEDIIIDFDGINAFTPSWGDEFLSPILREYGKRVQLKKSANLSVQLTLTTLERANEFKFTVID